MGERLANLGYFALIKEDNKGVPKTPNVFVPIYNETLATNIAVDEDNPIVGNKAARYQILPGQREHIGDVTILAEPNIAGYIFDMFLKKGSSSGVPAPFTHPFTLGAPNSYTVEMLKGIVVFRYMGVEARAVGLDYDVNKSVFNVALSALHAFTVRKVASVVANGGYGPYTVTLETEYDDNPVLGLVVGDIIQFYNPADGTTINATVAGIGGLTTFDTVEDVSGADAGWLVYLRGQDPGLTLQTPFAWSATEFRFGATAGAALTAAQTRMEKGSMWNLIHALNEDAGEKRSGSRDPAALVRLQGDAEVTLKKFFDSPVDEHNFLTLVKKALVVRHFSNKIATTKQELRITLNHLKETESLKPLRTGEIVFIEGVWKPQFKASDDLFLGVTVINNVENI